MGTDINIVMRKKVTVNHTTQEKAWEYFELPPHFRERDYDFFTVLASVRNGYTSSKVSGINSFVKERGLPKDFDFSHYTEDSVYFPNGVWGGLHDFGYLTLAELRLNFELAQQIVRRVGYFTLEEYSKYLDGVPLNTLDWCGVIDGDLVIKLTDSEVFGKTVKQIEKEYPNNHVYIKIKWEDEPFYTKIHNLELYMSFYEDCMSLDDDIQILFGFDS
jgi:hypothetical protein